MTRFDDSDEIKDLIKRKAKLLKDSHRQTELGDIIFQIGYSYYEKGYYKEALEEFEHALDVRKKLSANLDTATTHRFLGETLCKLGNDFERAKLELDLYYSITLRINDLVEIQRALTTLGNYFMSLAECNYKEKRIEHLNDAYTHYLKSYDILNEISEKRLVDSKEFGLMKARTCLNCAFAMDEKRDLIICNEYLKSAIEICENNHFYEDLIRCLYIKCDQAKRKGKVEETLKVAERIVEITQKTKDYVQQSQDFAFVADIYIKVQNFEKAKILLKKAYKLKKNCLIGSDITKKLKEVINIINLQNEINILYSDSTVQHESEADLQIKKEINDKIYKTYEKLGDSYCYIGLYELGLNSYFKQLNITKTLNKSNSEIAVIYSSIAQTYQDLENYTDALKYFELELKTYSINEESECKSLMNVAAIKEKLQVEFHELKEIYMKAYEKAKKANKISLQLKVLKNMRESQISYCISTDETTRMINSLTEINKIRNGDDLNQEDQDEDQEEDEDDDDDNESLLFSSESDDDGIQSNLNDEENAKSARLRNAARKTIIKRNLRGETQLHVACIKGNLKLVKKLIEEGHPLNERDNLNWLPIHEACNYGYVEIVETLIKHGAKVNDSIGPITPIHDAAQNGHLEVVKLLLKAGALSYVFSKDGYTPLDFLCKYKEENEKNMSQADLDLYREIYGMMLESIKGKDRNYKIKKVIHNEDNIVVNETETELDSEDSRSKSDSRSYKSRNLLLNDLDLSDLDENSNENSENKTKKKKKAVSEYKQAICGIGSKSNTLGSISSFGKKAVNKVIISESEYSLNDKWLINDLGKSSSSKRKCSNNIEDDDDFDDFKKVSSESNSCDKIFNDDNSDEDDFLMYRANKKSSKKRMVDTSSDTSNDISVKKVSNPKIFNDESNLNRNFERNSDLFDSCTDLNVKSPRKNKNDKTFTTNRLKEKAINENNKESENDEDDLPSINSSRNNKEVDLTIDSPFKNSNSQDNKIKQKIKLKQPKIQNFGLKSASKQMDSFISLNETKNQENKEKHSRNIEKNSNSCQEFSDLDLKKQTSGVQSWKVKAIIDNRNFLIPISNINLTIDELTTQIITRYKTIFSNDPTFREPEKVIIKSSDDLILFGEDLIKDVLTDMCQVHVVIESYKNAPKLNELYEQTCLAKNVCLYTNVKELLKESEESFNLNLKEISFDFSEINKQFEIMFESIKLSSKQLINNKIDYLKSLTTIDLSCNYLTDQIAILFFENILFECSNLKILNLAHNLLTIKSLKALNDLACTSKSNLKSNLQSLDCLNLCDNDIGSVISNGYSNSDLAIYLSSILKVFLNLREINISDCRIDLENSGSNQMEKNREETSIKTFFQCLKNSKIKSLNISYNRFGNKYLNMLVENLVECNLENINCSNS